MSLVPQRNISHLLSLFVFLEDVLLVFGTVLHVFVSGHHVLKDYLFREVFIVQWLWELFVESQNVLPGAVPSFIILICLFCEGLE